MIGKGVLYAIDAYECAFCPDDPARLEQAVRKFAREAGLEVVEAADGAFAVEQYGDNAGASVITLVAPLRQSHIALHTWPKDRFISLDFYTCVDPYKGYEVAMALAESFGPKWVEHDTVWRGLRLEEGR